MSDFSTAALLLFKLYMQETDEQKMIIITRYHLFATLMTELQCQKGPGISIIIRMHALIKVAYNNM